MHRSRTTRPAQREFAPTPGNRRELRRNRNALRGMSFAEQEAALSPHEGSALPAGSAAVAGTLRGEQLADRLAPGLGDRVGRQPDMLGGGAPGGGVARPGGDLLGRGTDFRGAGSIDGALGAGTLPGGLGGGRLGAGGFGGAGGIHNNPAFASGHGNGAIFGGSLQAGPSSPGGLVADSRLAEGETGADMLTHQIDRQMLGMNTSSEDFAAVGQKLMSEVPSTGNKLWDAVQRGIIGQLTGATVAEADQKLINEAADRKGKETDGSTGGSGGSSEGSGTSEQSGSETGNGDTTGSSGESSSSSSSSGGSSSSTTTKPAKGEEGEGSESTPNPDSGTGLKGAVTASFRAWLASALAGYTGGMTRSDVKDSMKSGGSGGQPHHPRRLSTDGGLNPYILTDNAGQSGAPALPGGGFQVGTDIKNSFTNPGAGGPGVGLGGPGQQEEQGGDGQKKPPVP